MLMTGSGKAARVQYLAGTFRLLSDGDHVVCAVTGARIPLLELRYWSVERQEPYVDAEASLRAERSAGAIALADPAALHAALAVDAQEIAAERPALDRDLLARLGSRRPIDLLVRLPHRIRPR